MAHSAIHPSSSRRAVTRPGIVARLQARLVPLLADPFEVLHKYYWSAPWLERKLDRERRD